MESTGSSFYSQLDELRKLGNRVHIQNIWNHLPRNEYDAFNEDMKLEAERALEKTLRLMAEKYERKHDFVAEFKLPWDAHHPSA